MRVVADQRGTPTWARSLANMLWSLADDASIGGILHWVDGGTATWYDLAVAIQAEALALGFISTEVPIDPVSSLDLALPASRPKYSVLDASGTRARLGLAQTPWRENLRAMMQELDVPAALELRNS